MLGASFWYPVLTFKIVSISSICKCIYIYSIYNTDIYIYIHEQGCTMLYISMNDAFVQTDPQYSVNVSC